MARSRTPQGPYRDISGTDMSTVKANPDLPLFDDATIQPHGTKIAGNHRFLTRHGTPGTGYVSPGGCSPWYDRRSGESFIVFHTRFPGRGEFHQVRAHRMMLTKDGWPVILPFRHAGEYTVPIDRSTMTGHYAVVRCDKPIAPAIPDSVGITLSSQGTISGSHTGRWHKISHNGVLLDLDETRYSTVFARQWEPDLQDWSVTFSGIAADGTSVWGAHR